jgi:hypothetical protein
MLRVAVKGFVWLPESRKGWGWSRVVGVLRQMLTFLKLWIGRWLLRRRHWKGNRMGVFCLVNLLLSASLKVQKRFEDCEVEDDVCNSS